MHNPSYPLTLEQAATSITSKAQLQRFLDASGRHLITFDWEDLMEALRSNAGRFTTFVATDLVDATWDLPHGIAAFQAIVAAYRSHRQTISAGRTEIQVDPGTGTKHEVEVTKGEVLELNEMKAAVEWLTEQIREKEPHWAP